MRENLQERVFVGDVMSVNCEEFRAACRIYNYKAL